VRGDQGREAEDQQDDDDDVSHAGRRQAYVESARMGDSS
jgi:hypothetical protein